MAALSSQIRGYDANHPLPSLRPLPDSVSTMREIDEMILELKGEKQSYKEIEKAIEAATFYAPKSEEIRRRFKMLEAIAAPFPAHDVNVITSSLCSALQNSHLP